MATTRVNATAVMVTALVMMLVGGGVLHVWGILLSMEPMLVVDSLGGIDQSIPEQGIEVGPWRTDERGEPRQHVSIQRLFRNFELDQTRVGEHVLPVFDSVQVTTHEDRIVMVTGFGCFAYAGIVVLVSWGIGRVVAKRQLKQMDIAANHE